MSVCATRKGYSAINRASGQSAISRAARCSTCTPEVFTDCDAFRDTRAFGRRIATTIEPDAVSLSDFTWQVGDVVVLGRSDDGLPDELTDDTTIRLRIPMPDVYTPKPASYHPIDPARTAPVSRDGMPNLNVAMAAAILVFSAYSSGGGWS